MDRRTEAAFFLQQSQNLGKQVDNLNVAANYLEFTTEAGVLISTLFPKIASLTWISVAALCESKKEEGWLQIQGHL